jgi:hypothetical protein
MAIHIEKDGWRVSADTIAELEAGVAAVQRVLQGSILPERRPRGRPPGRTPNGDKVAKERTEQRKRVVLPFLQFVANNPGGVTAKDLVATLHLKSDRAIGSVGQTTNRLLKELHFSVGEVYISRKNPGHEKTWVPRARIQDCIKAVEGI